MLSHGISGTWLGGPREIRKKERKEKKKRKAGERRKKGREERKRKGMQCSEVGTTPYLSERYGGALGGCVTC